MPWPVGNGHHIQASIRLLLAQFWYIMDCKMVLDSVASNNVSFSENHAFYTPHSTKLTGGKLVLPCPSVHPTICPSVDRMVSALYLPQY